MSSRLRRPAPEVRVDLAGAIAGLVQERHLPRRGSALPFGQRLRRRDHLVFPVHGMIPSA